MSLSIGIVGLPNVGKSTLFNALVKGKLANVANYPFATIEPNVGIVEVPDERLEKLAAIFHPPKIIPATVKFIDIAGLVRNAHQGEGLGNQFLSHIRQCDAIAMVVRNFQDPNVTHVAGKIDPEADIETVNLELALADLAVLQKRSNSLDSEIKAGNKEAPAQKTLIEKILPQIEKGTPIRDLNLTQEESKLLASLQLITAKPIIYVLNISEDNLKKDFRLAESAAIPISAKIEAELAELNLEDQKSYLKELGFEQSGLNRLIKAAYEKLGLITYFTTGPKEVHAWPIRKGVLAPQAAGEIHSDFEKGFIAAEVINFDNLVKVPISHRDRWNEAKNKGLIKTEGKDYIVQDGDVMVFRFNI